MRHHYQRFINDLLEGYIYQKRLSENRSIWATYILIIFRTATHNDPYRLGIAKALYEIHNALIHQQINEPEYIQRVYNIATELFKDESQVLLNITHLMIQAASDVYTAHAASHYPDQLDAYAECMKEQGASIHDWKHAEGLISEDFTNDPYTFTSEEAADIYLSLHSISWLEFRNQEEIMHKTCLECAQELRTTYGDELAVIAKEKLKSLRAQG